MKANQRRGWEQPPPTADAPETRPYVSAAAVSRSYTCGDPNCLASGTALEMYNLACDPQSLTEEKLKGQVRCPACAAKVARKNKCQLGEPSCGVYPLARTLSRRAEAASRPGPLLYCCEDGCENRGHPPTMYNTSSNPAKTSLNELIGRVRCPSCAAKIARTRQRPIGETGCGVFPLAYTMRQIGWTAETSEDARLTALSELLHRLPRVEIETDE